MQKQTIVCLIILCFFAGQSPFFGQKPDYSGTWVLNMEKSKLEHRQEGLTGSKFIIKQDGDRVKLTRYHIYGEKKKRLRFKMVADGKTRRVKLLFKGKLEWKDNSLRATLWRKNFLNIVDYKFGSDQHEFIADEVFTGYPKDHHNIWVFDSNHKPKTEIRSDFKAYYDQFQVDGSFALYDQKNDHYIFYNKAQFKQPFSPASTFKICNTLIGLETGVIKDENFVIHWDSVVRNPVWDKDHDLKTAFKNSTVWYYQELARRVGGQKMKYWLDQAGYGNADTSGGIDNFWLEGGLRISPEQQLDFLKRLHDNRLPFSQRSMDIVKNIMLEKDTQDYVVRAKTGWGGHDNTDVGWYVGYVETANKVYYFANCVQIDSKALNDVQRAIHFDNSRIEIVYRILENLGVINN